MNMSAGSAGGRTRHDDDDEADDEDIVEFVGLFGFVERVSWSWCEMSECLSGRLSGCAARDISAEA